MANPRRTRGANRDRIVTARDLAAIAMIEAEQELERKKGHEKVTFTITCTMKRRWAVQFLGMLAYMQQLGSWGSSRTVAFFADGDGDFRPKFEWEPTDLVAVQGFDAKKSMETPYHVWHDGDRFFDAG